MKMKLSKLTAYRIIIDAQSVLIVGRNFKLTQLVNKDKTHSLKISLEKLFLLLAYYWLVSQIGFKNFRRFSDWFHRLVQASSLPSPPTFTHGILRIREARLFLSELTSSKI